MCETVELVGGKASEGKRLEDEGLRAGKKTQEKSRPRVTGGSHSCVQDKTPLSTVS